MRGAQFVTVWVKNIGGEDTPNDRVPTQARRIFNGDAAVSYGYTMEVQNLIGAIASKGDSAAVRSRGRLTVQRLGHDERHSAISVEQAGRSRRQRTNDGAFDAERA